MCEEMTQRTHPLTRTKSSLHVCVTPKPPPTTAPTLMLMDSKQTAEAEASLFDIPLFKGRQIQQQGRFAQRISRCVYQSTYYTGYRNIRAKSTERQKS